MSINNNKSKNDKKILSFWKLNISLRKFLIKMSSKNTVKSPKKSTKSENKDSATKFGETIVLDMSRGKLFNPTSKENTLKSGEVKRVMSNNNTKELSGIKTALKKDKLFSDNYKAEVERAEKEAISAGSSKSAYTRYMNPENFIQTFFTPIENESEANFMSDQNVIVPSLNISATLRAIFAYINTSALEFVNDKVLKKNAARVLVRQLYQYMIDMDPHVITVQNLDYNSESNEINVEGKFYFNSSLWSKENINQNELDKLSDSGIRTARNVSDRLKQYVSDIEKLRIDEIETWWNFDLSRDMTKAVEKFLHHDSTMGIDELPKKADDAFSKVPVSIKKITHDNFLEICNKTGSFANISFGKIPKDKIKHAAHDKHQVVYDFCDMNDMRQVTNMAKYFPLKIDGITSHTETKTSSSKKASSTDKTTLGYIIDRYFSDAGLSADSETMPDKDTFFDDLISGVREMDVNKEFFTKNSTSGFRCSKVATGKTHQVMFSDVKSISRQYIEDLYKSYTQDKMDSEFWEDIINLLKATIKISSTRANPKDGTQAETSYDRTENFFNIVLKDMDTDITTTQIMSTFIARGKSTTDDDM